MHALPQGIELWPILSHTIAHFHTVSFVAVAVASLLLFGNCICLMALQIENVCVCVVVCVVFFVDRNQETFDMLKCAFVSISMVKFCCTLFTSMPEYTLLN